MPIFTQKINMSVLKLIKNCVNRNKNYCPLVDILFIPKRIVLSTFVVLFISCQKEDTESEMVVKTKEVFGITVSSANVKGDIIDLGEAMTDHGVYFNTIPNAQNGEKVSLGKPSTIGEYNVFIEGLNSGTDYYAKAYGSSGNEYVYGNEIVFTTTGVPVVSTIPITNITDTTATSGGNATDDGGSIITARGICWNTSPNPTTSNSTTSNGDGTGVFSSSLVGLTQNTTYYVRAYAINSVGITYGNEEQFVTLIGGNIPTLTTSVTTDITQTTATSGGNVTDDGGNNVTVRGVCWDTSPNPNTSDNTTINGSGTGIFTSLLTELTTNTTYYVRAYATNIQGTEYGNQEQFTTSGSSGTFPGETIIVAGGTFQMGSNDGAPNEQPIHTVTLSSFSISKYEITNSQYAEYMNDIGANSDGSFEGVAYLDMNSNDIQISYSNDQFTVELGKENYPVTEVTWFGAKAFSEYYGGRLPSEAEWEFAALGGNSSNNYTYSGSDVLAEVAWHYYNSDGSTQGVGTLNPNEIGLFDMSGNVYEWCNDWFSSIYYNSSPSNNPLGPASGISRVFRGGAWLDYYNRSRIAYRSSGNSSFTGNHIGFRPVFND